MSTCCMFSCKPLAQRLPLPLLCQAETPQRLNKLALKLTSLTEALKMLLPSAAHC